MNERKKEQKEDQENVSEIVISLEEYQRLTECQAQLQEYSDKLLRLHADFDNYRKRSSREKEQFVKYANEGLIFELISVLDNFERAFELANTMDDFASLHQGVEMILKQVHGLLKKNGVKKIECVGKNYDPTEQEAIAHVETEEYPENTVVEEVQKGYKVENRLIRPAIVKVAKKPEKKDNK